MAPQPLPDGRGFLGYASSMSSEPDTAADSSIRNPQSAIAFNAIHQGDCVELLAGLPDESVDLAFADPPYNIGFKYDEYQDNHEDEVYLKWCESWIEQLHRVVKPTGAFWLAIGDEYAAELKVAAKRIGFSARNWVVWYYTFGQNCTRKFNRSHAHLFHFVKDEEQHTFNAADPDLRVPSARALVYGDRRANPLGRLPDDTWLIKPGAGDGPPEESDEDSPLPPDLLPPASQVAPQEDFVLRPQDLRDDGAAFHPQDNTWYFSRVAGTFKERQGFHGCQMPEQLLGRIVRASSSAGELVLDPFAGSGTTLAVAKKLGRSWLGFELSTDYVKYANERIEGVAPGDGLSGPADPVRSSPTTAKGRRLKGHPMADKAIADKAIADSKAETPPQPAIRNPKSEISSLRDLTQQALIDSFHAAAEGASLDWLLCRPDLQTAFQAACEEAGLLGGPYEWNRQLLKLRKSGAFKKAGDREKRSAAQAPSPTPDTLKTEVAGFGAEIAWAKVRTKHSGASLDDILCDPDKLQLFDAAARKAAPGASTPAYRWAALRLRKAAKNLKAEAVQYEFVVAKLVNQLATERLKKLTVRSAESLAGKAGAYVVATTARPEPGSAGYVGEADDLGARLAKHPLKNGGLFFACVTDESLPSDAYRQALRWNLTHRLRPTLSIDLLDEAVVL